MATVTGIVEKVSTNYGKYSILVNGNWYGTKEEYAKVRPVAGETVTFDDGGGKFTKKLKIISGEDGSVPATTPNAAGKFNAHGVSRSTGFPIDPLDKQVSIIRQNAVGHAINIVALNLRNSSDAVEVKDVIKVAKEIEAYTAGFADAAAAKKAIEELTQTQE